MNGITRTAASTRSRRSHLPQNRRLEILSSPVRIISRSGPKRPSSPILTALRRLSPVADAVDQQPTNGPAAPPTSPATPSPVVDRPEPSTPINQQPNNGPAASPTSPATPSPVVDRPEPSTPTNQQSPAPFNLRGKIVPYNTGIRIFRRFTEELGRRPTIFGTYEEAMSADDQQGCRFFKADDGSIRGVYMVHPSQSMLNDRKRKAIVSEAELIAQHDSPQQITVPDAQQAPQHASPVEMQIPGFLTRMRTHIATAYYFVGRNTVTAGFRHVYDRVTRTFTRRPGDVEEIHGTGNGGTTVKRIHRSRPDGPTVKRFKRLPHSIRDRNPDGHNNLRPDTIPCLTRFDWTDDVTTYIGKQNITNIHGFFSRAHDSLVQWRSDRSRLLCLPECPRYMSLSQIDEGRFPGIDVPFSIAIHNQMIANFAEANEQNMLLVAEDWEKITAQAQGTMEIIYSQATLQDLRNADVIGPPTQRFTPFNGHTGYNKAPFRNCAELMGFLVGQREAMGLANSDALALAQVAMDFDAWHKEEIPVSYVKWEVRETPGLFPNYVEDLLFDEVPLDELKFDFLYDYRAPDPSVRPYPSPRRNDLVEVRARRQRVFGTRTEFFPTRGILARHEEIPEETQPSTTPDTNPSAEDDPPASEVVPNPTFRVPSETDSTVSPPQPAPTNTFRVPSETDSTASPMNVEQPLHSATTANEHAVEVNITTARSNDTLSPPPGARHVDLEAAVRSPETALLDSRLHLATQISAANISMANPRMTDTAPANRNAHTGSPRPAGTRVGFLSPVAFYTLPTRVPRRNPGNRYDRLNDARYFHEIEDDTSPPTPPEALPVESHLPKKISLGFYDEPTELEKLVDFKLELSAAKKTEHAIILQKRRDREEEERRIAEEAEQKRADEARRLREEEEARTGVLRDPKQPIIPSLTEDWETKVTETLSAAENRDLVISPENTWLKKKDFRTVVLPTEWLNDEIVNSGLIHLADFINKKAGINNTKTQTAKCLTFNSFFGTKLAQNGAEGTARQTTRKGLKKDNFLDVDTILVPICKSNHWTLVVVRPKCRTITHMDSLQPNSAGNPDITSKTLKWVRNILGDLFIKDEWEIVNHKSPAQVNGWDCGVHAVTNGMCLALGIDPKNYKSDELPLQRRRIAAVILNGGFTGDFELAL